MAFLFSWSCFMTKASRQLLLSLCDSCISIRVFALNRRKAFKRSFGGPYGCIGGDFLARRGTGNEVFLPSSVGERRATQRMHFLKLQSSIWMACAMFEHAVNSKSDPLKAASLNLNWERSFTILQTIFERPHSSSRHTLDIALELLHWKKNSFL